MDILLNTISSEKRGSSTKRIIPELQNVFYRRHLRSMILSNLLWTSAVTAVNIEGAGAIGIEDVGKGKIAGMGEVEVTGVSEDSYRR